MELHRNSCIGHRLMEKEADIHAERLTALAKQARLLEFALKGEGDAARSVASEIEAALTDAMEADSADELTKARDALDVALEHIARLGMRFTAQLTDMEIGGILGKHRMPVLTAVLSAA
jgi:hypothetical protein